MDRLDVPIGRKSVVLGAPQHEVRPGLVVIGGVAALTSTFLVQNKPAHAIPMITTDEFRIILRDSAQAIKLVEFSGPKSEVVTVKLVDGTSFGLSDVIESSIDPRSPLKIAAMCRENLVATKFASLEAALSSAPKKKKIYSNERVQIAAEKEKARKERMEQDEALDAPACSISY